MKRIFVLVTILLSIIYTTNAQLLWKVSGKGIKKSYIFGTNHLAPASFLDSIPYVYKAFNSTQIVVGEIIMNAKNINDTIRAYATLPEGVTLKSLLSDADYTLVDSAVRKTLFLNLNDLNKLKPIMIATLYQTILYQKLYQNNEDFFLDSYFQQVGEMKNKKIIALESVEQQSKILFGYQTLERQAKILVEAVKDTSFLSENKKIIRLYKEQKIDSLLNMVLNDTTKTAPTKHELNEWIFDRNSEWAKKLPAIFKQNSAFVAVGAGHLAGKNGLIALLRKKGFKVQAIMK